MAGDLEQDAQYDSRQLDNERREGHFQRWLSLVAGVSGVLSGIEVSYEHYKGSYSRPIMYTPVILSGALLVAGTAGFFSRRAARTVLPAVSILTLADCATGFYFHVRGIARKPGGWRLPVVNMVMGPPVFAPLLFGVSAYLGVVASRLHRPEKDAALRLPRPASMSSHQDARERAFQNHLAIATAAAAFLSGFEAAYSHYKNNFQYEVQWTPLIITPLLMAVAIGAVNNKRVGHTWLPAVSALAMADGALGFAFHVRGTFRRSGGSKKLLYNIIYGPPLFAPLLFAASGFLGVVASLLGSEDE